VTEHKPFIDFENLPAPTEDFLVTHFLTVRSVAKSRAFYSEVLGGQVVLKENPCMIKLSNSWLIMNRGGGPSPDKPNVSVVDYEPRKTVSSFLNLRVADIQACYEQWSSKGAEFVTPPGPCGVDGQTRRASAKPPPSDAGSHSAAPATMTDRMADSCFRSDCRSPRFGHRVRTQPWTSTPSRRPSVRADHLEGAAGEDVMWPIDADVVDFALAITQHEEGRWCRLTPWSKPPATPPGLRSRSRATPVGAGCVR
jgi:hypothetical protein